MWTTTELVGYLSKKFKLLFIDIDELKEDIKEIKKILNENRKGL